MYYYASRTLDFFLLCRRIVSYVLYFIVITMYTYICIYAIIYFTLYSIIFSAVEVRNYTEGFIDNPVRLEIGIKKTFVRYGEGVRA